MRIKRHYRHTGIPASALRDVRQYIRSTNSASLGQEWGGKINEYRLFYDGGDAAICEGFDEVAEVLSKRGDTTRHLTNLESRTGRLLRIDASDPTRIIVDADNNDRTIAFLGRVEELLHLSPQHRCVFLSHGHSNLWTRVQSFIEKESHLNLDTIEYEQQPKGGRTVGQKLRDESDKCSFAVIVMTGDDEDAAGDPRVRENVMHEIGFFQGRYGFDRVSLLYEEGVSLPSNLSGLLYEPFPKGNVNSALIGLLKDLRVAFPLVT